MNLRFAGLAASVLCLAGHTASAAPTLTTISIFNGSNGIAPYGAMVADSAGNLYGVTDGGGTNTHVCPGLAITSPTGGKSVLVQPGCGVVFKVSGTGATRTETVLHDFALTDGATPGSSLTADSAGNLYGTAGYGGKNSAWCPGNSQAGVLPGCGLVFKLTRPAAGRTVWTQTIIYQFSGSDGAGPDGNLAFDAAGNLYGATVDGGASTACPTTSAKPYAAGCGVAFKLSPPSGANKNWTETVLHSFGNGKDGQSPRAGVVIDKNGDLYGTTTAGGGTNTACPADATVKVAAGCGVVFRLSHAAGATNWTEAILDAFAGAPRNPAISYGTLLLDKAGNLYGTSSAGGAYNSTIPTGGGTVFMLSPPAVGKVLWKETVLHSFGGPKDGSSPYVGLVSDAAGNLYGTTLKGGYIASPSGYPFGTVFELSPPAAGKVLWTETGLATFNYFAAQGGIAPESQLVRGPTGALYGTTITGTSSPGKPNMSDGTVFKLTP